MKLATAMTLFVAATLLTSNSALAQETSEEKKQSVTAKVVDGKVIIELGDGKTQVIDLSEAKGKASGVVVEQKVEVDDEDKVRTGRAVIIGPDGKRQVVELDELPALDGTSILGSGDLKGRVILRKGKDLNPIALDALEDFAIALDGQKFMIGVSCEELDDALSAHLDLSHGLVVREVVEDAPAEKAGIKKLDILVKIDGEELKDLKQLVQAVQTAGDDDRAIEIKVRRKGESAEFSVKPEKRKAALWSVAIPEGEADVKIREKIQKLMDNQDITKEEFRVERLGPGFIQKRSVASDDMKAEIEELKRQIEELQSMIRKMRDK